MSAKDFKFVSPGVFIEEIDNSQLPKVPIAIGPVVIGRSRKGPAFQPVRIDSFSEFVTIFGNPVGGQEGSDKWRFGIPSAPTFAAYAAQAWLKNSSPITFIRLLGDQSPDADSSSDTALAGWKSADRSGGTGGGAYGLFLFNSSSASPEVVDGTLAAVFYTTEGIVTLSGSVRGGNGSDDGSGDSPAMIYGKSSALVYSSDGTFHAQIFDGSSNTSPVLKEKTSFNFSRGSKTYIRKVFNTDPTLTNSNLVDANTSAKTYFLGQTFESEVAQKITSGGQYGIILGLGKTGGTIANGGDFKFAAKGAKTGWVFSQDLRNTAGNTTEPGANTLSPEFNPEDLSTVTRLFKVHSISQGEDSQRNYKITIEDLKYSRNDATPYGSFSLGIRDIKDTDNARQYVEKYANLSLDPSSENYIAKQIGDKYYEWDSDQRRLIEYGSYDNRSSIIRVEMASAIDAGTADPELLPFGVEGPLKLTDFTMVNVIDGSGGAGSTRLLTAVGEPATDQLITLVSTDGTSVQFKAAAANNSSSDPITFNKTGTAHGLADFKAMIEASALAGKITVSAVAEPSSGTFTFTLTQAVAGVAGDTTITSNADNYNFGGGGGANGVFAGGSDPDDNKVNGRITTTAEVLAGTGSGGADSLFIAATGSGDAPTGVRLQYEARAEGDIAFTGSVTFPSMQLRLSSSDGDLGDPTDAFFGLSTNRTASSLVFDESVYDLSYPLPSGDPGAPTANVAKTSWYFSLDDLVFKSGTKNIVFYRSGSRADGDSVTARSGSYKDILDRGYDRFTAPLYGGFNGFDITEAEPFNDRNALSAGSTETSSAMFYSVKKSIDMFSDPEFIEGNILVAPGIVNEGLTTHLLTTCEQRGDSLAIIDPRGGYKPSSENSDSEKDRITPGSGRGGVSQHVVEVGQNLEDRNLNSSYGAVYYPWVRISDTISGKNLWAPPSVAALGAMSFSENNAALWFAPAGFNRGGLSDGAAGIPVTNVRSRLTSAERDFLYERNINPIASFPNEGIVIFGQKTLQVTPSALKRDQVA